MIINSPYSSKHSHSSGANPEDPLQEENLEIEDVNSQPSSPPKRNSAYQPRILVTEDNQVLRELITHAIQKRYPTSIIETAENGEKAHELCVAHQYDIITTDFEMPQLDGISATKRILATPLNHETPIIGFTDVQDTRVQQALETGMRTVVCKTAKSATRLLLDELDKHCPKLQEQRSENPFSPPIVPEIKLPPAENPPQKKHSCSSNCCTIL